MPDARWSLSRVTVTDGTDLNRYTDVIDYSLLTPSGGVPAGFYDRDEREFYGFSRVVGTHGLRDEGCREGDCAGKRMFSSNQTYHEAGRLIAEYDSDMFGGVYRGSATQYDLSITPGSTATWSQYVSSSTSYELSYEQLIGVDTLDSRDPRSPFFSG